MGAGGAGASHMHRARVYVPLTLLGLRPSPKRFGLSSLPRVVIGVSRRMRLRAFAALPILLRFYTSALRVCIVQRLRGTVPPGLGRDTWGKANLSKRATISIF